jgi:transposase InsO family protein
MEAHRIKLGRDGLFNLLEAHHLLIRKRKTRVYTTQSFHRFKKYPNQIKDFVPTGPNQLWVSDITYWLLGEKFCYISLITDAYSHKIVGYHVGETLEAIESIQALNMALSGLFGRESPEKLIHHSDRGVQYCSDAYINLLQAHKIGVSMSTNSDPLENALAERVNGILKEEYLAHYPAQTIEEAKVTLDRVIGLYNTDMPHMTIGNYTPNQIHEAIPTIKTEKLWKNYYQEKLAAAKLLESQLISSSYVYMTNVFLMHTLPW